MNLQQSNLRNLVLTLAVAYSASSTTIGQEPATQAPAATSGTKSADNKAADKEAGDTEQQSPVTEGGEDENAPPTQTMLANEGRLRLTIPAAWQVVEPRNRLIEIELSIPPAEVDEQAAEATPDQPVPPEGRLTMMAAGGDVDSNIRRWVGQFRLGRDADGKDAMRREDRKLRRAVAHVLDIAGTYFDSPKGPFGPKVELPDYRMLGAIIEIEGAGKYFVKFYGPADLVEQNREAFEEMLTSLEVVEPTAEQLEASPQPNVSEG